MKITGIDCHVLLAPNYDKALTSSAQDSFIVAIHTDEGITGFGESDVNPWIAKICIEAPGTHTMSLSLRDILLGTDPSDIAALWRRMYVGTCMHGRPPGVAGIAGGLARYRRSARSECLERCRTGWSRSSPIPGRDDRGGEPVIADLSAGAQPRLHGRGGRAGNGADPLDSHRSRRHFVPAGRTRDRSRQYGQFRAAQPPDRVPPLRRHFVKATVKV
jgi:hypothetical protein